MPWHVAKSGSCPASNPWGVIKDATGEVEGCHATQESAQAQVKALYANEPKGEAYMSDIGARRAAAMTRDEAPRGVGSGRSGGFPAQLRVNPVDRNGQQMYHLSGIASVVETPYEMWDSFGDYKEIIDRSAFTETLACNPDVAFLVNHRGMTMARTVDIAGRMPTLQLGMVDRGLQVDAWVNQKRQDIHDLLVAIEDGLVSEMSFAFMLETGDWSEDFNTFRISKVNLDRGDVSAVNYGANPYTSIAARAREVLADVDHLPEGAARAAMARLHERYKDVLQSTIRSKPDIKAPPKSSSLVRRESEIDPDVLGEDFGNSTNPYRRQ